MMPVRHGKSEMCSQYFPAWYLGRHPDHRVILVSYESGYAETWGEKTRDVLAEWGPSIFGINVHRRRNAAGHWRLDGRKGEMISTGIVGGVTGRGANLLIIDDPIKSSMEANSETYRNRVWDLYTSTIKSRLEPEGIVLIVMTRWHQDDLAGRILNQHDALPDQAHPFDVLKLTALYDDPTLPDAMGRQIGDALWPWRYTSADLEDIKNTTPQHWWNALYQQRPTPPGGGLAKSTWFPVVHAMPAKALPRVRFWDCAGTEALRGSDPDWTVGALLARDGGRFYIENIIRVRWTAGEIDKLIKQTAVADGVGVAIREEQEPGSSGLAVISQRRQGLVGFNYRGVPAVGAKSIRWMPMLIQAEVGNVCLMYGSWNAAYQQEISEAPYGAHDDQLDATAGAFQELARGSMIPASEILGPGEVVDAGAFQRKIF